MSSSDEIPAFRRDASPTPAPAGDVASRRPSGVAVQQTLPLSPVTIRAKRPASSPTVTRRRLWLCIYLPRLPLEALYREASGGYAVFEEQQGIRRIRMVDDDARAAGIEPGLSVNAALSLNPGVTLAARDRRREANLLKNIAAWSERFTSFVVVESAKTLLLEVAGSLQLFGSLERIRREIGDSLSARGLSAQQAVAPTPLASVWLARSGQERHEKPVPDVGQLSGRLSTVPLAHVGWPSAVVEKMRGTGIACVGDCLRLPRQGFARRFGIRYLNDLDRALGKLPDPREHFCLPERFSAEHEFDAEEDDSERILSACRELLLELEHSLRVRQVQIQRIRFSFFHLRAEATHLALGCVRAGQGVDHWFDLLRIRFEQMTLPEPAIAIRLRGGRGEAATLATPDLLDVDSRRPVHAPIDRLVERLSARMGASAVQGVTTVAEHRPQYAWRMTPPLESPPHCAAVPPSFWNEHEMPRILGDVRRTNRLLLRRPLWILEEPQPLPVQDGCPRYAGRVLELDGPERLESGWWDEAGIARDYYVARTEEGVCLWVYRDRQSSERAAWFLHGMFG